jgi:hypothetical protein
VSKAKPERVAGEGLKCGTYTVEQSKVVRSVSGQVVVRVQSLHVVLQVLSPGGTEMPAEPREQTVRRVAEIERPDPFGETSERDPWRVNGMLCGCNVFRDDERDPRHFSRLQSARHGNPGGRGRSSCPYLCREFVSAEAVDGEPNDDIACLRVDAVGEIDLSAMQSLHGGRVTANARNYAGEKFVIGYRLVRGGSAHCLIVSCMPMAECQTRCAELTVG